MAGSHPLCDYCAQIPFLAMPASGRYGLGSWSRIFASHCRFCQLVKYAYCESYRTDPRQRTLLSSDVIVSWGENYSFFERPAFRIHGLRQQDICFVTQTSHVDRNSAYLRPFVEAELDVSRVSHWISTCATAHGNHCTFGDASFASAFPGLHVLRLIDVMQHCLVETQEFHRYVALSYIWGAVSNFKLTKSNLSRLLVPGVLQEIFLRLPRTICDAVTLCRMLNVRYLWVDALCLLQNDPEDLERGVDVMDQIYERAWLTIFAATGTDANAGLPGVQVGSRRPANLALEVQPGILLGVCAGLDSLLEDSMYSSRGWTFQEHVLSRRGLYFVDNKVFFRCRTSEFSESCIDCDNAMPRFKSIVLSLSAAAYMDDPLPNYSQLLTHYTCRALTDPGDVLRAMAGIIRRISEKVECRFIQGLPSGAFDSFILFESWTCILRRRKGFPSYSWCGWQGRIWLDILHDNDEWLSKTWIIWYKRSQSGVTNLVWDHAANDSCPFHDTPYVGYRRRHTFKPPAPLGFATTRTAPTRDRCVSR
ncbi:HET domain-containing protein [Fusarium falciforme]|uniref:HET domain-containing protein n=1 Tax=Fusarium falciforme TaxID=195108 RepID=UPI0022FFE213|nr:HET domain-containing protein [Fusarium falciforme]WAO85978.1 HET domain-containing protein [Fusarium falciforme]